MAKTALGVLLPVCLSGFYSFQQFFIHLCSVPAKS